MEKQSFGGFWSIRNSSCESCLSFSLVGPELSCIGVFATQSRLIKVDLDSFVSRNSARNCVVWIWRYPSLKALSAAAPVTSKPCNCWATTTPAAIAYDIDTVALDRDGRRPAGFRPVKEGVLLAFWHDPLPEKIACVFVKTHQDAAVRSVVGIAGVLIVGANLNTSTGVDRGCVGLGSEAGGPFDDSPGFWIEGIREALFLGNHIAGPGLPPLRLVGGQGRRGPKGGGCHQSPPNEPACSSHRRSSPNT